MRRITRGVLAAAVAAFVLCSTALALSLPNVYVVHIKSYGTNGTDGQWVVDEGPWIKANRSRPLGWETFLMWDWNGGSLVSGDWVSLMGRGGFVNDYWSNYQAFTNWANVYTFVIVSRGCQGCRVSDGSWVHFRTLDGRFLCAESGGGKEVVINRRAAHGWESFQIRNAGFVREVSQLVQQARQAGLDRGEVAQAARRWSGANPGFGVSLNNANPLTQVAPLANNTSP